MAYPCARVGPLKSEVINRIRRLSSLHENTTFDNTSDYSERYEYDDRGRQTLHVSVEGVVTQFVYDAQTGRLAEQRFFDDLTQYNDGLGTPSETWSYAYDAFGRQVKVTRTKGAEVLVTDMTYDARGQLIEVASPEGTVSYTYDDLGRRLSTIVGTLANPERITSYTYDALGRLATVTEDLDPDSTSDELLETSYHYDLVGNLDRTDLPNGVVEDYEYDSLNRLDKLTQYAPDETPEDLSDNDKLAEFDYTVGADGRRTSVTETFWYDDNSDGTPDPHVTQTDWEYDELGRLIDEAFDHFDDLLDQTAHFTYDLNGNRLKQTIDEGSDGSIDETTDYIYDANDRLITEAKDSDGDAVVDQTTTYGYDHTQQTSKTVVDESTSQTTSSTAFTYDLQGRMETVTITTYAAGVASRIEKTTYDYNSSGIRVSALHEVDTDADGIFDERTLTEYLNDARSHTGYSQVIRETHYDADTGLVTKTVDYTFGHDEIAQTVTEYDAQGAVTSQETHVFGHDGHGSVRVLTDMAAAVVQLYFYDAYGQILGILNGAGTFVSADAADALTTVLYSGEQFDSRIGQQYLRARWYNPATGTFNRLDPFFGNLGNPQSLHKYLYTHADPISGIDPTGRATLQGMAVAVGVFSGLAGASHGAILGARDGAVQALRGALFGFGFGVLGGLAVVGAAAGIAAIGVPAAAALGFTVQFTTILNTVLILGQIGVTFAAVKNFVDARDGFETAASISDLVFVTIGWSAAARGYFQSVRPAVRPTNTGEITGITAETRTMLAEAIQNIKVEGENPVMAIEAFGSRAGSTYRPAHDLSNSDLDVFITLDPEVVNTTSRMGEFLRQIDEISTLFEDVFGIPLQTVSEIEPIAPSVKAQLQDTPFITLDPQ